MKRLLFIFCAIAVGSVSAMAQDEVIEISTKEQLIDFASAVNAGTNYSGKTVKLTANIAFSEYDPFNYSSYTDYWIPIGTPTHPFNGTFDGANHQITNLVVDAAAGSTGYVAGLFGKIGADGIVKDVTVTSVEVRIEKEAENEITCFVGAIAGYNGGTIVSCANRGDSVFGNWNFAIVGGIAGENSGTIQNCYNLGSVYTGSSYTGNFLGGIAGNNPGTIRNCFVRATIENNSSNGKSGIITANNGGTVVGCFYMNGTTGDLTPSGSAIISLANASSNSSTIGGNTGSNNILLQDRIIYSDEAWNTFCVPFSIPAGADGYFPIAGATVMELDPTDSNFNSSTGALTLNFKNATTIEAGKPYIIKWDEAIEENLSNPVFLGVTVEEKSETERAVTTTDGKVTFQGIFDAYSIAGEDKSILYLGAANKLYYPNGPMNIGSCRAYFKMNDLTSTQVKSFVLNFGDDDDKQTGISAVANAQRSNWYTLDGRHLQNKPTQRGIYVNNGKKVIIKSRR